MFLERTFQDGVYNCFFVLGIMQSAVLDVSWGVPDVLQTYDILKLTIRNVILMNIGCRYLYEYSNEMRIEINV